MDDRHLSHIKKKKKKHWFGPAKVTEIEKGNKNCAQKKWVKMRSKKLIAERTELTAKERRNPLGGEDKTGETPAIGATGIPAPQSDIPFASTATVGSSDFGLSVRIRCQPRGQFRVKSAQNPFPYTAATPQPPKSLMCPVLSGLNLWPLDSGLSLWFSYFRPRSFERWRTLQRLHCGRREEKLLRLHSVS